MIELTYDGITQTAVRCFNRASCQAVPVVCDDSSGCIGCSGDTASIAVPAHGSILTWLHYARKPPYPLNVQRPWHPEETAGAFPTVRPPRRASSELSKAVLHASSGESVG